LASRRIYLGVATRLREHRDEDENTYLHTGITNQLRKDVVESEHLVQFRLANMVAYAALHANPAADVEKGSLMVNKAYRQSLNMIPYLTVGMGTEVEQENKERLDAVESYKKMRELEGQNG